MPRKLYVSIALLLSLPLALYGCGTPTQEAQTPAPSIEPAQPSAEAYTPFGDFETMDLNGAAYTQALFGEATLTMINIWGTYCDPCIREMPYLGELASEYADKGLQIIGIVTDVLDSRGNIYDANVELAKDIVKETGAAYVHLLPSTDLMRIKLNKVSAIPETVFVDQNGFLVGKSHKGALEKADWEEILDAYLEEAQARIV